MVKVIVQTHASRIFEVSEPEGDDPELAVRLVWDAIEHGRAIRCRLRGSNDLERHVIFGPAAVEYISTVPE